MKNPEQFTFKFDANEYTILSPIPPFVDIILKNTHINQTEFLRIVGLTSSYQSDPRLIEMVRMAGDTSAKIPYLIDEGETAESILDTLRQVAKPHVEHLNNLPHRVQATIHTLLSINKLPAGYDMYGIPALLEVDRMQRDMIHTLKELMVGRKFAEEFYQANLNALKQLDHDWPSMRQGKTTYWPNIMTVPEKATMQYEAEFEHNQLKYLYETCVIVNPPKINDFKRFIPPVLQRPLAEKELVPVTGSADWLIREVGKVGRHITRALLEIIAEHLTAERIDLEYKNYELINRQALEVLDDYIKRFP